jgi:hypothetical protein
MPVIIIHGLEFKGKISKEWSSFEKKLRQGVSEVLNITKENMTIETPVNAFSNKPPEIICIVEGLFVKPGRTHEVKENLSKKIVFILADLNKNCDLKYKKIEVLVKTFNPEKDGFATWSK